MKYTLYLRAEGLDFFLQKGWEIGDLQKSHETVRRWIAQMNLTVPNPGAALLVIAEADKVQRRDRAILEARYVSGTRRTWRDIPPDIPGSVVRSLTVPIVPVKTPHEGELPSHTGESLGIAPL